MTFLVIIIILALIFDYINGFHDAANSIATIVSTKVLTPFQAVLMGSYLSILPHFLFQNISLGNLRSEIRLPNQSMKILLRSK